jgi:hypothetical protein
MPIGTVWALGSWVDGAWADDTWADLGVVVAATADYIVVIPADDLVVRMP